LNDQEPQAQEPFDSKAMKVEHGINPPNYEQVDFKSSTQLVIDVLEDSFKKGYLNGAASRHQVIIVDDNFRLSDQLKKTIRLTGHLIQLRHVACGANYTTSFMGYRNAERDVKMKDVDRDIMGHMQELFETTSRGEAGKVIEAFTAHAGDSRLRKVKEEFGRLKGTAERDQDVAHDVFFELHTRTKDSLPCWMENFGNHWFTI
jgi:hypothetical protein